MEEVISLYHKAEVILTDVVFNRAPIEMEYEKTYIPMVIEKKKNYVGMKYEMDTKNYKVDFKGIAVKRRNYCPLVKETFWSVIYPVIGVEKNEQGKLIKIENMGRKGADIALSNLGKHLAILETEPLEKFAMSAKLMAHYKNENLPHIQLAKRMQQRDAGSAPQPGQRFQYIIIHSDTSSELCDKSEELSYAIQNKLEPDYIFYINNQLYNPIYEFMALIGKESETRELFDEKQNEVLRLLKKKRQQLENESRRNFFTKMSTTSNKLNLGSGSSSSSSTNHQTQQKQQKPLIALPKVKKMKKKPLKIPQQQQNDNGQTKLNDLSSMSSSSSSSSPPKTEMIISRKRSSSSKDIQEGTKNNKNKRLRQGTLDSFFINNKRN